MSKGSQQQQPKTPRERKLTPVPPQKQSSKADNGKSAVREKPAASVDSTDSIGVIPSESEEDDFFARGEVNSYPPAAMDPVVEHELLDDPVDARPPLTRAQIERRAHLRRIVGCVVGAAAVMTAVVGAKALSAPARKVADAKGSLNVPQQVVPSIALAPEATAAAANAEPAKAAPAQEPVAQAEAPTENAAPQANGPAEIPPPGNPATENSAPAAGEALKAEAKAEAPKAEEPASSARRLPVIDIEIPQSSDPAIDEKWETAAKSLSSKNFSGADSVFAELGKRGDAATREAARLARAVWWTANGRENEVRPVIADLAANATTPSVRAQARERIRAN
jgi:hypothetical protein